MSTQPSHPNPHRTRRSTDAIAAELSDAQIAVMRDAFDWIAAANGADGVAATLDSVSAIMLLDLLTDPHAHYLAMRLARALHTHPPAAITRPLSPLLMLAVAVAVINAGATSSPLDPDNTEQLAAEVGRLGDRVQGLYDTESDAQAANHAIGDTARVELAFQAGYLLVMLADR